MKIKQNLKVFIGEGNLFFDPSITPNRTGQFKIWYDENRITIINGEQVNDPKWILDSENHSYMKSPYGTDAFVTWGHFEEYSGNFEEGMVFTHYKHNEDYDSDAISVKLKRFSQKNGKMYVPALYGNTYIVNAQNKQKNYAGKNSIPKNMLWYNPLQNREERMYYISVQPQTYTIVF